MANLSDIKLMTREEAETLINTRENAAEYLFDGWGSKFRLQDFTQTSATAAGDHYPDTGYIGFQKVTTITGGGANYQEKTATVNGPVTPDATYDALSKVTVAVPNGTETKTVTANGTYTPTTPNIGFSSVTVNVPTGGTYQEKTVTANGEVTPDVGYDALSKVTVNVPSTVNNEDKTITANGTYTASAGYTGLGTVIVNVPASTGDTYMPYFTNPVTLDGTETTEFRAHINRTDIWGPNTWIPGADYAIHEMKAKIDGTDYDYVSLEIQGDWSASDFDENGNIIFRLTGNYKAYDNETQSTVIKEGSDFTMKWIYDRVKDAQAASEHPTDPFILADPGYWVAALFTYHSGAIIEGYPVQAIDEYKNLIYFKVN